MKGKSSPNDALLFAAMLVLEASAALLLYASDYFPGLVGRIPDLLWTFLAIFFMMTVLCQLIYVTHWLGRNPIQYRALPIAAYTCAKGLLSLISLRRQSEKEKVPDLFSFPEKEPDAGKGPRGKASYSGNPLSPVRKATRAKGRLILREDHQR